MSDLSPIARDVATLLGVFISVLSLFGYLQNVKNNRVKTWGTFWVILVGLLVLTILSVIILQGSYNWNLSTIVLVLLLFYTPFNLGWLVVYVNEKSKKVEEVYALFMALGMSLAEIIVAISLLSYVT